MNHAALTTSRLPELYRSDHAHGWSMGMRRITRMLIASLVLPPGIILELGSGSGYLLAELQRDFPQRQFAAIDLHPLAIAFAGQVAPTARHLQADMQRLPFDAATVAAVLSLDSLDQTGLNPDAALEEMARVLVTGGYALVRVSAYPWLWGPHDAAFNTRHRYAPPELARAFRAAGFSIQRLTYANTIIGCLAVAPRLLQRWGILSLNERKTSGGLVAGFLLKAALYAEARWLQQWNLPAGLSLYVVAKNDRMTG
jgi:ubiquinone/menaquinone biosynthesis C-methylase UbiE